jgi:hypothetical protein
VPGQGIVAPPPSVALKHVFIRVLKGFKMPHGENFFSSAVLESPPLKADYVKQVISATSALSMTIEAIVKLWGTEPIFLMVIERGIRREVQVRF